MKKKIKKAFTLVELLVVIAILAILATVSIVGYNSFTKKAKVSNDTVLVKQMNDVLLASSITDGNNTTMTDALNDVFDGGYDLTKLTPTTTNYNIMWDSANDQMVLADEDLNIVYPEEKNVSEDKEDLFVVVKNENELNSRTSSGYSVYLHDDFTATTITNLTTGIDTGKVTSLTSITYVGNSKQKDVVIKTNSGILTVNANDDTVYHYGEAENVNIQNIDLANSYHEFGNVGYVEIANGHFVAEANSTIIALVNTGDSSAVKIDANANANVKAAYTTNESSKDKNHGGNLSLKQITTDEKGSIIYDAEAQYSNAIEVNGKYFKTLSDAFDKVKKINGEGYLVNDTDVTITLYKDIVENGLIVENNNNSSSDLKLIIDFNGHTYDVNGTVGSTGTPTNGLQLKENCNVTLKNGKLTSNKAFILIQNYSDLTLDNMVIDGTGLDENNSLRTTYALSNNNGEITINDTIINGKEGCFAFDVCRFSTYESVHVTVKGNSVISGKIEVSASYSDAKKGFSLTLESGNFENASLVIDNSASNLISENKITKLANITFNAPTGYTWDSNGILEKN